MAIPDRAFADTVNITEDLNALSIWDTFGPPMADVDDTYLNSVSDSKKKPMYWGIYTTGEGESEGTETGTIRITGTDTARLNSTEDGYLDPWGLYAYVNFEQAGSQNFFLYPNWNDATRGGEYDSTGTINGTVTVNETGQVTITDNSTEVYTEQGIEGYYSGKLAANGETASNNTVMFQIMFGTNIMTNGDQFRVVWPSQSTLQIMGENGVWASCSTRNMKVFRYYSNHYYELPNSGGVYTTDGTCNGLLFVFNSSGRTKAATETHYFRLLCRPYILLDASSRQITNLTNQTITNTTNVTNTVTQQTQQQTTALKDTTGSDGIVSSAVNSTQSSLVQKLGFVAQIPTIMSEIYQAVTHEGGGTVHFPGVSWEGQTIWPAADVPIVGWMPDSVQNPIRLFNTIVLFLAWMRGVHLIYLRIVRPIDAVIEAVGDED